MRKCEFYRPTRARSTEKRALPGAALSLTVVPRSGMLPCLARSRGFRMRAFFRAAISRIAVRRHWAVVQRQDSGFWFQLSRFESWWPSHFFKFFLFTTYCRAPAACPAFRNTRLVSIRRDAATLSQATYPHDPFGPVGSPLPPAPGQPPASGQHAWPAKLIEAALPPL